MPVTSRAFSKRLLKILLTALIPFPGELKRPLRMSPNFPPGARLGRYEIKTQLGASGMGEVYLAQDTMLDRKVALKILSADKSRPIHESTASRRALFWRVEESRYPRLEQSVKRYNKS